jgi:hypothetical protein
LLPLPFIYGRKRSRVQRFPPPPTGFGGQAGFRGYVIKRILNIECRMLNVEGMYSARREPLGRTIYFIEKIEQACFAKLATKAKSETTL